MVEFVQEPSPKLSPKLEHRNVVEEESSVSSLCKNFFFYKNTVITYTLIITVKTWFCMVIVNNCTKKEITKKEI